MSFDLGKVIRYGQKIGAEVGFVIDGTFRNYYKKGSKESKYCCLTYTNHNNGRPLRWESSNEHDYRRIADFYRSLGFIVELIEIPALQAEEDEQGADPDGET